MHTPQTARTRIAMPDDAPVLAKLIDIAGEGIPSYLWARMAGPGETALEVGAARARRETGSFSYRNATIAEVDGEVAAMLLGYVVFEPSDDDRAAVCQLPAPIRPFVELEHQSVGTYYVNALAVLPGRRGCGVGSRLLHAAEHLARAHGVRRMSIQVFTRNAGAARLYHRFGYRRAAERPMLYHPSHRNYDGTVLLLLKDL